ncbi:hypothetical protein BH11BAC1_BH11BAC1_15900 [soil metagenome]
MSSKSYLAIYDEQKLISGFFQNNLERFYKYNILFSTGSREFLLRNLNPEVGLLLFHGDENKESFVPFINEILLKFDKIKVLIYSGNADEIKALMKNKTARVKVVSMFDSASAFLNAIINLLPDHQNHKTSDPEDKDVEDLRYEKIRQNRKWILILKMIADGKKPKEMTELTGLKYETIISYIEQMIKETDCGNISQVLLQASRRNII